MSKKSYLLCALLALGLALLAVPAFAGTQTVKTWNMNAANPGWTLSGDWAYGIPTGLGGSGDPVVGRDPNSTESGGNVLGNNLAGNYAAGSSSDAVSETVNLTGNVGVKLHFAAWLNVQDSLHDQASVSVSTDGGGSWTEVWVNSANTNTIQTSFVTEDVDISDVADGQTIQLRFSLVSDASVQFGGWNLKSASLTAEADNPTTQWLVGAGDDVTTGAKAWSLDTGWTVGAPFVGTSGQTTTEGLVGADPATANTGALVLGYNIGANYERSMTQKYATTPVLDLSSKRAVKLSFYRWLAVEDARYDHAAVQINNDDKEVQELFSDDFSGSLSGYDISGLGLPEPAIVSEVLEIHGAKAVAKALDTSEFYSIAVSAKLGATFVSDATTDHLKLQWSKDGGSTWNDIPGADITATQALTAVSYSIPAGAGAEENPNFRVRAVMTGVENNDIGRVDDLLVEGVQWVSLWTNPIGPKSDGSKNDLFETAWSKQLFDLSDSADGNDAVRIRFVMGPSDSFTPTGTQVATEFGGWSIDDVQFTEGTTAWLPIDLGLPASMAWGAGDTATFTVKNCGTGYWDDTFSFVLTEEVTAPAAAATDRWGGDNEIFVDGTVDMGAETSFDFGIVAPPLSTIAYKPGAAVGSPGDEKESAKVLDIAGALKQDPDWIPLYNNLDPDTDLPTGTITVSRFPDIQPGTDGYWARFWTEELAGRVPYVVQGFTEPDGSATYRPLLELDRAAMSVYIQRAKGLPLLAYAGVFRDVESGFWAAKEIEALWRAGVVQGYPPDFTTFQPTNIVTRDQMAKFIANGAGLPIVAVGTDPFSDVPVFLPGTSTRNGFVDFIAACKTANVVVGYSDGTYRPAGTVSRDQLAVFVWRAFLRPTSGAAVVLAGPAITAINPGTAAYVGWPSSSQADGWKNTRYMYAQFDRLRFGSDLLSPSGPWQVKFELRDAGEATAAALRTWAFDINNATLTAQEAAGRSSGVPYYTVSQLIPQWTPTTLIQGDFTFVVSSRDGSGNWSEVVRKPAFKNYGRFKYWAFDAAGDLTPQWTLTGDPAKPALAAAVGNLSGSVVKFVKDGQMKQSISTLGWQSMIVSFDYIADNLSSSETFTVEYSVDGGTNWSTGTTISNKANIKDADLPKAKKTSVSFSLPGTANDNPNFQMRITLNAGTVNSVFYLDKLQIKGL